MAAEEKDFESNQFKRYVKISAIVHVAILLGLTIQATFFTDPPIQFEKAIRVDMVGLPEKIKELPPAPPAKESPAPPAPTPPEPVAETPPPKKEPPAPPKKTAQAEAAKPKLPTRTKEKDPDAVNLDKTKSKQKQALEKLKQMEALEKIQQELESENKKKAAQAASQVKYKGNVLSAGSELTGVNKLQAETYISDVHRHILQNWSLPEYLKNKRFRTDVVVRFDQSGNVLSKEIVKASGNPLFDEMVLSAIQKSSPVPVPPDKFSKIASIEGFLFRFSHDF